MPSCPTNANAAGDVEQGVAAARMLGGQDAVLRPEQRRLQSGGVREAFRPGLQARADADEPARGLRGGGAAEEYEQ